MEVWERNGFINDEKDHIIASHRVFSTHDNSIGRCHRFTNEETEGLVINQLNW